MPIGLKRYQTPGRDHTIDFWRSHTSGCPIFGAFFAPKVGIRARARTAPAHLQSSTTLATPPTLAA